MHVCSHEVQLLLALLAGATYFPVIGRMAWEVVPTHLKGGT